MPLSNEANSTLWPIDNERKEIRDITTEYTHVESFRSSDRSILPPKHDFAIVFTAQPPPGCDDNRLRHSPYSTKPVLSHDGLETERLQIS